MTSPNYKGLQAEEIPTITLNKEKVTVKLISGNRHWGEGAFETLTDVQLNSIHFRQGGEIKLNVPAGHNIFFYVARGKLEVNNTDIHALHLADFNNNSEKLEIKALDESILLFGHAKPFNEPVVAQGPFVMNTEQEIKEAHDDYRKGKFGRWL